MQEADARRRLADAAALWSADAASSADVIRASCDALVAGVDSPGLRELAGVSFDAPSNDVEDLLPGVLDDLDIPFYERGCAAGRVAAAKVRARQCAAGELSTRGFVAWVHATFRHGESDELEPFLVLDDDYDIAFRAEEEIDQAVREAVARFVHSPQ